MREILILTSRFLPEPDANGINVNNIAKELIKRGYKITCLSYRDKSLADYQIIDGIEIYRITPSFFSILMNYVQKDNNVFKVILSKLCMAARRIKLILLLPIFPNFDILQQHKTYKAIKKITKIKKYDMIIGVFKPFTNISALLKFKRKNPEVLCGAYFLDLINSMQKPNIMPDKLYNWMCTKTDYKVFSNLDFSLVAKAGKELHKNQIFNRIKSKIDYIDFPTFNISDEREYTFNIDSKSDDNIIKIIYAGTLDKNYRNPDYLLKILKELTGLGMKINFDFYGRGNCDEILNLYNDGNSFKIINHGLVDPCIVRKEMQKCDFVVNISNEIQSAVPSKIFELFSTGKPILNVGNENDITNTYFTKYPSSFLINKKQPIDPQLDELYKYISEEKGNSYCVSEILKSYVENTPGYTVDLIESKF